MLLKQYSDGVEILSVDESKIKTLLKEIVNRIKAKHSEVKDAILFGSFSKKEFTPYSDIDIAIIVDKTEKSFVERTDDFIDYFLEIPFDVNLIVYTAEEFKKMINARSSLIVEIINGIRL